MTIFTDTQLCLDRRLNTLGLGLDISWDNVEYTTTKGQAWVRPTMVSAPSALLDLATDQVNQGIYQIDVFYPVDTGPKALLDTLGSIYEHFKGQSTLTYRTATVYVRQVSVSPFSRDGIWYTGSITVNFTYYSS